MELKNSDDSLQHSEKLSFWTLSFFKIMDKFHRPSDSDNYNP